MDDRPRIAGRVHETATAARALATARDGARAAGVWFLGEPGIGKTRLLASLRDMAESTDALVLHGRFGEYERDIPFGGIVEALDGHLDTLPAPRRMHAELRALLERLAADRPVVVALDDVHWADPESLEAIRALVRLPPRGPVLFALAMRPVAQLVRLGRALAEMQRAGRAWRLELGPLTRREADEVLGSGLARATRRRLYHESGGNPFYLEELARGARAAATSARAATPRAVCAAIAAELDALPVAARRLAQAGALAGESFDLSFAAGIAELSDAVATDALDHLDGAGLIRPADRPRTIRFRHPIVRHAVYESTPAGWRIAAHTRAADALAAAGASVVARAHHVARSARPGDVAAIALLEEAGRAAATVAPAAAARWYGAAMRLLPAEGPLAPSRLDLLVPMARALGAAGQLGDSRDGLREALSLLPDDAVALRAEIVAFVALIEELLGRHGEVRALLEQALAQLGDARTPEAAGIHSALAFDRFCARDFAGMRDCALAAVAVARTVADRPLLASALAMLANAHFVNDEIAAAREAAAESAAIVDVLPDRDVARHIEALLWLGWCERGLERYPESVRHLERGTRVARASGQVHLLVPMTIGHGTAAAWLGNLSHAAELAEEAHELAAASESDQFRCWALAFRAWVAVQRGDVVAAVRDGEAAQAAARRLPASFLHTLSTSGLAEAYLHMGEPSRARELLAGDAEAGPGTAARARALELLTRAELELGFRDEGERWARLAEPLIDELELPVRAGCALRARALVQLAGGRPAEAAASALEAAAATESAGARLDACRSRLLAGRALVATSDPAAAAVELERAYVGAAACGAERLADASARELRKLGRRVPGRRAGSGADLAALGLTGREAEIAELVAQGGTNREIAATLHLAESTVENHLGRVFSKLGIRSRAALAGIVERSRGRETAA